MDGTARLGAARHVARLRCLAGDPLERFLSTDANVQEQSAKINWVLNLVLAVCVSGAGVYLFAERVIPDWLALKILAVGAIFTAGVLLDLLFKPAVDIFIALADAPDDAELNTAYSRALSPVYIAVLAIYAFALTAAALEYFNDNIATGFSTSAQSLATQL